VSIVSCDVSVGQCVLILVGQYYLLVVLLSAGSCCYFNESMAATMDFLGVSGNSEQVALAFLGALRRKERWGK
jgi:hypothetical protein